MKQPTMSDIDKRLSIVEDNTKEILMLLKSNSDFNTKGLVETVKDTEERVRILELEKEVAEGKLRTATGIISFFVTTILSILYIFIGNKLK